MIKRFERERESSAGPDQSATKPLPGRLCLGGGGGRYCLASGEFLIILNIPEST